MVGGNVLTPPQARAMLAGTDLSGR